MTPSPAHLLSARCGGAWTVRPLRASELTATWRAEGPDGALFVKTLPLGHEDVLAAEADGLAALAQTRTIAVPRVEGCWTDDEQGMAVLAMQWLHFGPMRSEAFGRRRDNMLGGTAQSNRWSAGGGVAGWTEFFGSERLAAMRDRLRAKHAPAALLAGVDRVIAKLPAFFDDGHIPRSSLIHGDLWSGNWGMLADGAPVVFDPAVSVSDAETELAMMELFGAPPAGFWPAYRDSAGLAPGYARRRGLYQLYHLLNHELLFGGYARAAMKVIDALL